MFSAPNSITSSVILLLLTAANLFWLMKRFKRRIFIAEKTLQGMQDKFEALEHEVSAVERKNADLENQAEETIALFDITKEICKSLEIDTLVSHFKDCLAEHVEFKECKFLQEQAEVAQFAAAAVVPIEIDKKNAGSLVVSGLKDEDKEKFFILSKQFSLGIKRALLFSQVQDLAVTDQLTSVLNRRFFFERAEEEIARSRNFNLGFSFLIIDIDYFKKYNDNYGHLVGDVILQTIATLIKENIRSIDLVGKLGGDEFVVILSETGKKEAEFVAQRIRKNIEAKTVRAYDEEMKITVSIGVSAFPEDGQASGSLIEKADQALYKAKLSGRNRVFIFS